MANHDCRLVRFGLVLALVNAMAVAWGMAAAGETSDKSDPLDILVSMQDGYNKVDGYIAYLEKAEPGINHENHTEKIFVKFKKPHKVYLTWVELEHEGREILYIEGENDDCFLVKMDGFIGFFLKILKLPSTYKTSQTRYTVRQVGVGNMINSIVETTQLGEKNKEVKLVNRGLTQRDGSQAYIIERFLPAKDCYPNTRLVLYVDKETRLPLEAYAYGPNNSLLEYCIYHYVKLNPAFKDNDFSTSNREYGFTYL